MLGLCGHFSDFHPSAGFGVTGTKRATRCVMATVAGLDELLRAAEAAGFAMAAPDDDQASRATPPTLAKAVSGEDIARGARDVKFSPSNQTRMLLSRSATPNSVRSSAHTVRETVYGYLRFGAPA
jgi:hypothetical protein